MAPASACATCASTYNSPIDPASEKPLLEGRCLPCCGRSICARCLNQNKRYETYCPYCQITTEPSLLPQGLKDPPAYSSLNEHGIPPPVVDKDGEELPAYSAHDVLETRDEKARTEQPAPDVLHFLTKDDSMHSLALAYGVPINVLRRANNVFLDHLIQGRRTVVIPGEYYKGGVSLSPRPLEGEEEEIKKGKVRRWMMACKVAEYDVALLYLQQAEWNLDAAVEAYQEDERWEKEHPREAKEGKAKGKNARGVGMRRFVGGGNGQPS
ncbi:hypothetical protein EJ03DRAFT_272467 [Teratosphaeria nubilosa]|uniref:LysM domain-containing protein n=1 Tax=Teratosphaeria nubilosa TaxID=161662 RepID=A0A6G1LAB2_9PEZI|nr:hypothetical protein EJ03DRAFT_272467 [Teratosphaeria nubilosa]